MTLSPAELDAIERIPATPENRPPGATAPASLHDSIDRSIFDELVEIRCPHCETLPAEQRSRLVAAHWEGRGEGSVLEVRCKEHAFWMRVDTRDEHAEKIALEKRLTDLQLDLTELQIEYDASEEEHKRLLAAFEETAAARIPGEPVAERRRAPEYPRTVGVGPGGCVECGHHHTAPAPHVRPAPAPSPLEAILLEALKDGKAGIVAGYVQKLGAAYARVEGEKSARLRQREIAEAKRAVTVHRLLGVIDAIGIPAARDDDRDDRPALVRVSVDALDALRAIAEQIDDQDHAIASLSVLASATAWKGLHDVFAAMGADLWGSDDVTKVAIGTVPEDAPAEDAPKSASDVPLPDPYDLALTALKHLDIAQLEKVAAAIPALRRVAAPRPVGERYVVRRFTEETAEAKKKRETIGGPRPSTHATYPTYDEAIDRVHATFPNAHVVRVERGGTEGASGRVAVPVHNVWATKEDYDTGQPHVMAINGPIPTLL